MSACGQGGLLAVGRSAKMAFFCKPFMERLVDAAALLCFCSKRLSRAERPYAKGVYYC